METLRCHSNKASHKIGKQYTICVENNVNSMYAQYSLHPSYGIREEDF